MMIRTMAITVCCVFASFSWAHTQTYVNSTAFGLPGTVDQNVTVSTLLEEHVSNQATSVSVSKFDPSLGTLLSVKVSYYGFLGSYSGNTNWGSSMLSFSSWQSDLKVTDENMLLTAQASVVDWPGFNGDIGGPAGSDSLSLQAGMSKFGSTATISTTISNDLERFIGYGNYSFNITSKLVSWGYIYEWSSENNPFITGSISGTFSGMISLQYTYQP